MVELCKDVIQTCASFPDDANVGETIVQNSPGLKKLF